MNDSHEEEERKNGVADREEEAKQDDDEEQNETNNDFEFEDASSEIFLADGELREDDFLFCAERLSGADPDEVNPDDHSAPDDPVVAPDILPGAVPPNVSSVDSYLFIIEFPERPECPYYEDFDKCLFPPGIPCTDSHGETPPLEALLGLCTMLSRHLILLVTAAQTPK